MKTQVSIIVCTLNHCDSLRETLSAINEVIVPAGWSAEVLVVDNGSTDDTARVVNSANLRNMMIRRIEENVVGQSRARNRGLKEANGNIIVFTDDDVRPAVYWLERLCRPMIDGVADGVQGGVFLPPSRQFRWMKRLHKELFASTEYFTPGELTSMWGANMSFKRDVLQRVPAFDVELGPGSLGFADDALFTMQLHAAGCRLIYVPEASVEHWFDCSRLTNQSFRSRAFRDGQSRAYVAYHWDHAPVGEPEKRLRDAKLGVIKHYLRRPWRLRPSAVMNENEFWLQINAGYWTQMTVEQFRPRRYAKHGLILLGDYAK